MAVSGASAGYFAGWLTKLVLSYRRRPSAATLTFPTEGVNP
jgi:hypothetical protein